MRTHFDPFRLYLAKEISQVLRDQSWPVPTDQPPLDFVYNALVEPPNPEMGDLAFGCFQLAKQLKQNPAQVAATLKTVTDKYLSENKSKDFALDKVMNVGPYLNFGFSSKTLGTQLLERARDQSLYSLKLTEKTPRTMIEFSQPNTHKELHVGHMRNLCLGDALVRLLRYANYDIVSSTFPGDVGTHVAKCLWYLKFRNKEQAPTLGKGEWLGKMYSTANNLLEDQEGSPAESENKAALTKILHELEGRKGEYYDLWKKTRQWSIELMEKVYAWADVKFDIWYWESDVDSPSVAYVKKLLAEGKLQVSEGAVGMNLEDDKLGFCLLLKKDGTGLYATKDVELARRKFAENKIEKSIYVVDMRQALHFAQVFKVLEKLGFPQAKACYHLQYNFVELPDGAMSSRKGNIVPLLTLVHQMEQRVKDQYLSRYQNEWSQKEIDLVAEQVAKGAIKFGMIKIDSQKKIVFDLEEWLKIEGESGPFVQYSTARIFSLCRKLNYQPGPVHYELLSTAPERKLMQHLMHFNSTVVKAAEDYKPSLVCTFLVEAAKKFNHFYHECPIGQAENSDLKAARLALSFATGEILQKGLSLLGIPSPERM